MAMKGFDKKVLHEVWTNMIIVSKGKKGAQVARLVRVDKNKGKALYVADDGGMCWVFQHLPKHPQPEEV